MKNNLKKILAMALALVMVFALTACGGDEEEYVEEEQEVFETELQEDVAEEEAAPEEDAGSYIEVPVILVNGTGMDLTEIYCSGAGLEQWGDSILGADQYLANGTYLELVFGVDANNTAWDISCVSSEGQSFELYNLDISEMPADGFVIELLVEGDMATASALPSIDDLQGDYTAG